MMTRLLQTQRNKHLSYNIEVDMALNWAYTNCLFGVDPEWSKVAPGDVSIASMTKSTVPSVDGSVFKKCYQ